MNVGKLVIEMHMEDRGPTQTVFGWQNLIPYNTYYQPYELQHANYPVLPIIGIGSNVISSHIDHISPGLYRVDRGRAQ